MNTVIVLVIAGCLIAVTGAEINCYSCTGTSGCKDPFNKQGVSAIKCKSCMKSKITSGAAEGAVMRGCSTVTSDKCEKATELGVSAEICHCTKDLCNSGPLVIPSIIFVSALSAVFLLWKYM